MNQLPARVGALARRVACITLTSVCLSVGPAVPAVSAQVVGALGNLQPRSGVVEVSGAGAVAIAEVLVEVGQAVQAGDLLVRYQNQAELALAVSLIEAEIAQLRSNHEHDRSLAELKVGKARTDLERARASLKRYRKLTRAAQVENVRFEREERVEDAGHGLEVAKAELAQLATRFEQAMSHAEVRLEQAKAQLYRGELRSPLTGTVMEVYKRAGEPAGGAILSIADLTRMQVVSEVFEGDLVRVQAGQTAEVESKALSGVLKGTVAQVGRRVQAQSKVATVWIDLETADEAARYIGMEVDVRIDAR